MLGVRREGRQRESSEESKGRHTGEIPGGGLKGCTSLFACLGDGVAKRIGIWLPRSGPEKQPQTGMGIAEPERQATGGAPRCQHPTCGGRL